LLELLTQAAAAAVAQVMVRVLREHLLVDLVL
jgi:hypothetical protein